MPSNDSSSSSSGEEEPRSPAAASGGGGCAADPGSPGAAQQSSDESTSSGDVVLVDLPGPSDGRDETFEDASDQLGSNRNLAGLGESMAMIDFPESSSSVSLAAAECRKYKEEREVFGREVSSLRRQLRDMMSKQSLLATGNDGLLEHLRRLEQGGEEDAMSSPTPLHSMIGDCSKFVSHLSGILDERLNSESSIRELHAILFAKDQEIEDLHDKVSESDVSCGIVVSYLGSLHGAWSESMTERTNKLEEENAAMAEQVQSMKQSLEEANAETSRMKAELEQAESKFVATRERLSIAVQKGKSLVNTRDSLKQQLVEKTSELENCVVELQQKSNVLESAQASIEQLKQSLTDKMSELEKCLADSQQKSNTLESMETSAMLLNQSLAEKNAELDKCLVELQKKSDALEIADGNAEEIKRALEEKRVEVEKCLLELQQRSDELEAAKANEDKLNKAQILILSLQDSLLHRDRVLQGVEEVLTENDSADELLSLEVVDRVRWFVNRKHISDGLLLENRKIRNALSSIDLPQDIISLDIESQINWLGQSLMHAKDDITKMKNEIASALVNAASRESELSKGHEEIEHLAASLLEEKQKRDSLQDDLEGLKGRYEELAENLSIVSAEKDGLLKVLAEITESLLDEPLSDNTDALKEACIAKISQRNETYLNEREHFDRMQCLLYVKNQELLMSEKILEEVMGDKSEMTSLSVELERASKEIITLRSEKDSLKAELDRVEERSSQLRERLSMAVRKGKGLMHERDGLKQSLEEKVTEVKRLQEEMQLRDSSIADYNEQIKSLSAYPEYIQKLESESTSLKDQRVEIERLLQESNSTLQKLFDSIEALVLPSDENFAGPVDKLNWAVEHINKSEFSRANAMQELEKVKEEAKLQEKSLADAFTTIKSLENELSEAEKKILVFSEKKKELQLEKTSMEKELEKTKEENHVYSNKLADAQTIIKSLEDTLLTAETHATQLSAQKKEAEYKSEVEVNTLNAKLAECMEELGKIHGSLLNQSGEQNNYLERLQMLMKDESLSPVIIEELGRKNEGLRNMGLLIQNLHDQFAAKGLNVHPGSEQHPEFMKLSLQPHFEDLVKQKKLDYEALIADFDDDSSFAKIVEGLRVQAKLLRETFQELSRYTDDHITSLMQALQITREEFINVLELNETLKVNVNMLEGHNEDREAKVSSLQKDIKTLRSACTAAAQELQIEFHDLFDSHSDSDLDKLSFSLESSSKEALASGVQDEDGGETAEVASSLIRAARRIKIQFQQLANDKKISATTNDHLKHKLEQAESIAETAIRDRDLSQEKVSKLEGDLGDVEKICKNMKMKIEDYQAKEEILRGKEAELLSLQHTLTATDKGMNDLPFSREQIETLVDKVNKMEVSFGESDSGSHGVHFSNPVDKLFYIIDKVNELQHRLDSLAYEKEDMQLVLASHVREVEHLKKATETADIDYQDLEFKKAELSELTAGLEKIIHRLGGNDMFEDQKPLTAKELLPVLDRLSIALNTESESSKSKIQELGAKLQKKEKVVNELSEKVKVLEDSLHTYLAQPDIVKERSVFESSTSATGPEISEIEDMGPLGKNLVPPVSAVAHARAMRKESTEQLVLNINSESDRLINAREIDDKGHFFKSLNASGLIPKQGKLIADRIDGICVSGGRVLMSRPGARLSVVAYWLLLHVWLLGTLL